MASPKKTLYLTQDEKHSFVKDQANIIMLVSKQDAQEWSSWWRGVSSNKDHDLLRLLFLQQLVYTKPDSLIHWAKHAPDIYWTEPTTVKLRNGVGYKLARQYASIAPMFLHDLHSNATGVFYKLLDEVPVLFKGQYSAQLATWCKTATPFQLHALQPLLKQQDDSWYRTDGQRVQWLAEPNTQQMLNALCAAKNKMIHPTLEKNHPGLTNYVSIVEGLFESVREQRKEIKAWLTDSARHTGHTVNADDFALLM